MVVLFSQVRLGFLQARLRPLLRSQRLRLQNLGVPCRGTLRLSGSGAGATSQSPWQMIPLMMLRFANVESQLRSGDRVREALGKGYVVALTLAAPRPISGPRNWVPMPVS